MPRVTANGVDFAYVEAGPADAPLALCLHGFPDIPATWNGLLPRLADTGFHAVAPYMRGYAPSGPAPNGRYHAADLALDTIALADSFAGEQEEEVVVVGHDWGAIATWTAAAYEPERFRRIVSLAVPHMGALLGHLMQPEIIRSSWYQYFFQTPLAEGAVSMDDFRFIDLLWETWSPGRTPDPEHVRAVKQCLATDNTLAAAIGYYRSTVGSQWQPMDEELMPLLGAMVSQVMVPALYLHGALDVIYPPDLLSDDELRTFVPDIECEVVDGAGHFLHLERPDFVLSRIVDFVGG